MSQADNHGADSAQAGTVARLEALLDARNNLVEDYARLWAVHGGSQGWQSALLEIETAEVKSKLRKQLSSGGVEVKVTELKDALYCDPVYQARVRATVEGRADWIRVREGWTTLNWRIQLEMAKLRLQLGDEATPTDTVVEDALSGSDEG
jgi:hypothetical protein